MFILICEKKYGVPCLTFSYNFFLKGLLAANFFSLLTAVAATVSFPCSLLTAVAATVSFPCFVGE